MGRWTAKNPDGHERHFRDGPSGPTTKESDLLRCCHCGVYWYVRPGSKIQRGWCKYCGKPHCGGKKCWECSVLKQKVDKAVQRIELAGALGLQR